MQLCRAMIFLLQVRVNTANMISECYHSYLITTTVGHASGSSTKAYSSCSKTFGGQNAWILGSIHWVCRGGSRQLSTAFNARAAFHRHQSSRSHTHLCSASTTSQGEAFKPHVSVHRCVHAQPSWRPQHSSGQRKRSCSKANPR